MCASQIYLYTFIKKMNKKIYNIQLFQLNIIPVARISVHILYSLSTVLHLHSTRTTQPSPLPLLLFVKVAALNL